MRFLVRSPALRPLEIGDQLARYLVLATQADNEWAVVELPDAATAQALQTAGAILEYRPEATYEPLGYLLVEPFQVENVMGIDFPTIGITPAWQAAVDYGRDVVLGIADTGMPPAAARAAHFPDVELVNVYGGADTHGHSTACISRMVGPRGVLPECRKVLVAQALPNGSGSTTTVTQAIRALREAGADVISLSLGGPDDPVINREVEDAQARGVPCSAAMGNDGWNARAGSPARVARYAWGATTFDGSRPASFTTGGCNLLEEEAAIPGEQVGVAHLDGGYGRANGTSFSCPVGSAIVAALRKKGWVW